MRLNRPLTLVLCALIIAAAWGAALVRREDSDMLPSACAITLLCAAVMLHYIRRCPAISSASSQHRPDAPDELAEFRRGLFNLCAALKLGLHYCEDHAQGDPVMVVEHLQQMADNISAFVRRTARPVRFLEREGRASHTRLWWPWRATRAKSPQPRQGG